MPNKKIEAAPDLGQHKHESMAACLASPSAGSVVGAQLAYGVSVETLLQAQLSPPAYSLEKLRHYSQAAVDEQNQKLLAKVDRDLAEARRIGAFARRSETVTAAERRAIIAARLLGTGWPQRALMVVAADTETGEGMSFDAATCGQKSPRCGSRVATSS